MQKIKWIVSLRAFAAMAIVLLHMKADWYVAGGGTTGARLLLNNVVFELLARWGVPFFLMISGYLLLDPARQMGPDKLKRYLLRILKVLLLFGGTFSVIKAFLRDNSLSVPQRFVNALIYFLECRDMGSMWYLYALIGLYLITPLLRAFVKTAGRQEALCLLAVLYGFTILLPTVNGLLGTEFLQYVAPSGKGELLPITSACAFYYLGGYYFGHWDWDRKKAAVLLGVGAVGWVAVRLLTLNGWQVPITQDNAFVGLYAPALFILCKNAPALDKLADIPLVQLLSRHSFGIYLLHGFLLSGFYKTFHIFPDILPIFIGEMIFFVCAVASSCLGSMILCKIKPLRELLQ